MSFQERVLVFLEVLVECDHTDHGSSCRRSDWCNDFHRHLGDCGSASQDVGTGEHWLVVVGLVIHDTNPSALCAFNKSTVTPIHISYM